MSAPEGQSLRGVRGLRVEAGSVPAAHWREALGVLTDYRGDATLEFGSGDRVSGYVFDADAERIKVLPDAGGAAVRFATRDVTAIELTGRDTAEGRSFETWIRKWAESRADALQDDADTADQR
jgi:hypothetical protein